MTRVLKFETSGVEAKRFTKTGERMGSNVRIDQNSSITHVTPVSDAAVSIGYRFTVNYTGMGYIKMEGELDLEGNVEELVASWGKDGNMPPEAANVVHNTIMSTCLPTALLISRDIKLPPPFPLPRVKVQPKVKPRPSDGFEVA